MGFTASDSVIEKREKTIDPIDPIVVVFSGDIIFFDKKASGTCKRMGSVRSPSVSLEWAPDGRHVVTAVTAPRLRVDNCFQVFTYYGENVYREEFPELYEARWVMAPKGLYPDRPQSPDRVASSTADGIVWASWKCVNCWLLV